MTATRRRFAPNRFEVVLHDRGNAVQWADKASLREASVQLVRLFRCVWIEHNERIDGRPPFVVSVDAFEIRVDQLTASQPSLTHRRVDLSNRSLFNRERPRRALRQHMRLS